MKIFMSKEYTIKIKEKIMWENIRVNNDRENAMSNK